MWFVSSEGPQVLLESLINNLSLTIRLRVISCGHGQGSTLQSKKFRPKEGGEGGIPITNNSGKHPMEFKDILHIYREVTLATVNG